MTRAIVRCSWNLVDMMRNSVPQDYALIHSTSSLLSQANNFALGPAINTFFQPSSNMHTSCFVANAALATAIANSSLMPQVAAWEWTAESINKAKVAIGVFYVFAVRSSNLHCMNTFVTKRKTNIKLYNTSAWVLFIGIDGYRGLDQETVQDVSQSLEIIKLYSR